MKRWLVLSVVLIVMGGLVFYGNHQSSTIQVSAEEDTYTLLDYTSPEADPYPHHLIVVVDTSQVVQIVETLDGETSIIYTDNGSGKFTVEPGQAFHLEIRNTNGATGTIPTTFYGESMNYVAYVLFGAGTFLFVVWYLRSGGEIEDN